MNTYQDWMAFLAKTKVPSKGRPILGLVGTRIKLWLTPTRPPHVHLEYHGTLLVEWAPTMTFFSNGGYMTKTTKNRLNAYLPPTHYIQQKKGVWYLRNHANTMIRKLDSDFTIAFTHDGQLEWID